jgi:hypothetical protein
MMSKELEDFYKWMSDKLEELHRLDYQSKEAQKIKIEMGFSANVDFRDIQHQVGQIWHILDWYEEWKQKEVNDDNT